MSPYEDIDKEFGIEEEKIKKMAAFAGAEGGRMNLPGIDQSITVTTNSEPYKIDAAELKKRGMADDQIAEVVKQLPKGTAWFCRVLREGIEFDMPLSKTIWYQMKKEMMKHKISDIKGRTWTIIGKKWDDAPEAYRREGKDVKTYVVTLRTGALPGKREEVTEL